MVSPFKLQRLCSTKSVPPEKILSTDALVAKNKILNICVSYKKLYCYRYRNNINLEQLNSPEPFLKDLDIPLHESIN